MDISSARLTALLRQAMTPQAVPSARADPVRTALVKALVQLPVPNGVTSQPAAPGLPVLLPATAAKTQQMSSPQVVQAYLALVEPGADAASTAVPAATAAKQPATGGDEAQRTLAVPLAKPDDAGVARPAALPWLALFAPEVSPPRRASVTAEATERGQAASRSGDAARPERQMSVGLMSLAAGLLAAAIVGFVLLLLR
ncbi:hypothetical protein LHFGNBLO_004541 [Mesorhizobium sp. AR10]|uniref:hypothetical protein n=1 Tax=Mesorhizobium sp. AR10 TaxID=2865839 RepID=UPI0021606B45|nr:hypothetical protein [Mesorhizobium sp. AR10]UVK37496.1 hypothetical protein LHFGNBLO_004541 [Mesorhizobium sp. AR10]